MHLTVERVAILRHADLFASTPDRVLAGVAAVLEEVRLDPGDVLMTAGAVEDWMYVVAQGELDVVRPDRQVSLGPGSVVGELAVLDARPRSATVTARTPCMLLRLRKPAFDEAMAAQPEIARGVIAELVRRLRETHQVPTQR